MIKIITDGASDITAEEERELGIRVKNVDICRGICFGHSNCPDRLATFMAAINAKTQVKTDVIFELGAVVGTHAGQGCVGVAYFEK